MLPCNYLMSLNIGRRLPVNAMKVIIMNNIYMSKLSVGRSSSQKVCGARLQEGKQHVVHKLKRAASLNIVPV